tara:strand:+ start:470 stop:634 length:165 start_codon:yes stop_codon:yes gene_type:complete
MSGNELFTLLYGILDKLENIEKHLGIDTTPDSSEVKLNVVKDDNDNVVELRPPE